MTQEEALDHIATALRPQVQKFVDAITANLARQGIGTLQIHACLSAAMSEKAMELADGLKARVELERTRGTMQ